MRVSPLVEFMSQPGMKFFTLNWGELNNLDDENKWCAIEAHFAEWTGLVR